MMGGKRIGSSWLIYIDKLKKRRDIFRGWSEERWRKDIDCGLSEILRFIRENEGYLGEVIGWERYIFGLMVGLRGNY